MAGTAHPRNPQPSPLGISTYVYVDGENHFERSKAVIANIVGETRSIDEILPGAKCTPTDGVFPRDRDDNQRFLWDHKIQLLWDSMALFVPGYRNRQYSVDRAYYCCSVNPNESFDAKIKLRSQNFEPLVVEEVKARRNQREKLLKHDRILDKAKGCDIAIATRMVADAALNLYDCCCLFTSDADFIPAIEAVRSMGKVVKVFGYQSQLPKQSHYLHVPDEFVDLEVELRRVLDPPQPSAAKVFTASSQ